MTVITDKKAFDEATLILATDAKRLPRLVEKLTPAQRRWVAASDFEGSPGTHCAVPGAKGEVACVLAGVVETGDPWALAHLPLKLAPGRYALGKGTVPIAAADAAFGWSLGSYRYTRYRKSSRKPADLQVENSAKVADALGLADAVKLVRDLVNTPAEDMGPAQLAAAAQQLAKAHGARFSQVVGDDLLKRNFPAIHAVGRAADAKARAPRLIELTWGRPKDPKLTLVGKGVCFDSGGLDIKPADGMRLMKKDMGGAANVLGLASLVMGARLPVRLQVLIPAVENSIAGNAFRPGDVFKTRKGLHIEIGNTDAEGRVILCDALAYGAEGQPALMIDMATLTGAARVALGPQLPALFCRRMDLARQLVDQGLALHDPLWHLPLWKDYHGSIESDIADIVNTGKGPMGGAITAALFLDDFVPPDLDWLHLDLFAWNDAPRPGRPAGGEAQTLRTLMAYLEQRFGRG